MKRFKRKKGKVAASPMLLYRPFPPSEIKGSDEAKVEAARERAMLVMQKSFQNVNESDPRLPGMFAQAAAADGNSLHWLLIIYDLPSGTKEGDLFQIEFEIILKNGVKETKQEQFYAKEDYKEETREYEFTYFIGEGYYNVPFYKPEVIWCMPQKIGLEGVRDEWD